MQFSFPSYKTAVYQTNKKIDFYLPPFFFDKIQVHPEKDEQQFKYRSIWGFLYMYLPCEVNQMLTFNYF